MHQEQLHFETLKVDRGWYFVEYTPPITACPFATVQLVIIEEAQTERVAAAMEKELASWLDRYPVPVMVSSFDGKGDLVRLGSVRACDHIIGWKNLTPAAFEPLA